VLHPLFYYYEKIIAFIIHHTKSSFFIHHWHHAAGKTFTVHDLHMKNKTVFLKKLNLKLK